MPALPLISVEMAALFALIVAYGLLTMDKAWLTPLVEALANPHGGWIKRRALKAASYIVRSVVYVERHVQAALSRFAYWNLHLLTGWLNGLVAIAHETFREMHLWRDAVADFSERLVHHKIPAMIRAVTNPIDARARAADKRLSQGIDRLRDLTLRLDRSIDRLRDRTAADAARFQRGIDRLARENIGHRLRGLEAGVAGLLTRDLPALWRRERALERKVDGEISARLGRIEKALGLGLAGAVVYKVLARVAPWIFCRNVKKVGNALCGMNPNTLNALLAAAITAVAIEDLRTLTRYAQEIEAEVTHDVARLLGV